jgi:hypothetical protein
MALGFRTFLTAQLLGLVSFLFQHVFAPAAGVKECIRTY